MNCEQCKYWEQLNDMGRCRRNPPQNTPRYIERDTYSYYESQYPVVPRASWCGKFEQNETRSKTSKSVHTPD